MEKLTREFAESGYHGNPPLCDIVSSPVLNKKCVLADAQFSNCAHKYAEKIRVHVHRGENGACTRSPVLFWATVWLLYLGSPKYMRSAEWPCACAFSVGCISSFHSVNTRSPLAWNCQQWDTAAHQTQWQRKRLVFALKLNFIFNEELEFATKISNAGNCSNNY